MFSKSIIYWNREKQQEETEAVYGERWVNWLYGTRSGQEIADRFLSTPFPSRVYGMYQSSPLSKHKIKPFIKKFNIDMSDFEDDNFQSFNDFFVRRFKKGSRVFNQDTGRMPAFAEARYLGFEKITPNQTFPVKGEALSPVSLLGSQSAAAPFIGGSILIARLCPTDYHRFHYPDTGQTLEHYRLHGKLHSVNPVALKYKSEIFATNERQVSILTTRDFGRLAYIEVGAICVGKIVQTHSPHYPFFRGHEKGYFLFGASTVIVLGEAGKWKPDADILTQSARGRETLVRLGQGIGFAPSYEIQSKRKVDLSGLKEMD